jgi:hypothetical protein
MRSHSRLVCTIVYLEVRRFRTRATAGRLAVKDARRIFKDMRQDAEIIRLRGCIIVHVRTFVDCARFDANFSTHSLTKIVAERVGGDEVLLLSLFL